MRLEQLKKILSIPRSYSLYILIALFYALVFNQFFLGSSLLTVLVALLAVFPFYAVIALPETSSLPDVDSKALLMEQEGQSRELLAIIRESRAAIEDLCEKASNLSLGTDAQTFSLEETMGSIEGISNSIHKTVSMIEHLSPSVNKASKTVIGMIDSVGNISNQNQEVLKALEKAIQDIKEMNASVRVINDNFGNLIRSSEESSGGIKEINAFAKDIETSALESYKVSEDVAREAEHGVDSVRKTISSMENLKSIVTESSSVIKTLGDRSDEIGNIVKLIHNVTTRINLLALNASIIASQAGEHGKSFAVVANEMEKLASQTSTSTIEITQMIDVIQEMVQSTVQANEVGMWGVEEGVGLVNRAGEILKKIQERSGTSVQMSKDILTATGKQARMADEVYSAIERETKNLEISAKSIDEHVKINKLVDESANLMVSLTEEVKAAIDGQRNSSKDISEVISSVITMVEELSGLTEQQDCDSVQIKQATEIMSFISKENISAIKGLAHSIEEIKNKIHGESKPLYNKRAET
ncbi:MAG: methyl-accepting chemotaxis protein [Deltaproteobacteria bacterium]|nr:methyl-accepting chemotaxis protein [Deltaproteobacteria bacterium]